MTKIGGYALALDMTDRQAQVWIGIDCQALTVALYVTIAQVQIRDTFFNFHSAQPQCHNEGYSSIKVSIQATNKQCKSFSKKMKM